MNVPSLPTTVNRRLSASNSTSSSVATVKQTGSKIGHRKSTSKVKPTRPTSSDSINQHFSTLDAAAEHSTVMGMNDRGRSPNLNINRWSHSTSSSMGAVDSDFLRQVSGNAIPVKPTKTEAPMKTSITSKYSSGQTSESGIPAISPARSPGRRPRNTSTQNSPGGAQSQFRAPGSSDKLSTLTNKPEFEVAAARSNDYLGSSMVDPSRGANKYGQPVEGFAMQFTAGYSRPKKSDQKKLGNTLYQATNSSHISLQTKTGHSRRRDKSANGSKDTATDGSMSSVRSEQSKKGGHRSPTQKHMLSQALAKANQAVLLDNAQNIQGAVEAYHEACAILEEVLMRSNDPEDRKKLSAIRATYSTRIAELYDLDNTFEHLNVDKDLPDAPATTRYLEGEDRISFEDPEPIQPSMPIAEHDAQRAQLPLRQESLLPQIDGGNTYIEEQPPLTRLKPPPLGLNGLSVPMESQYMVLPLSPRRFSPAQSEATATPLTALRPVNQTFGPDDNRISTGSTSWLDTAGDENASSIASSKHSSVDYGARENELMSAIEADLDAAVDAAYENDYPAESTPRPFGVAEMVKQPLQPQPNVESIRPLAAQPSQESVTSNSRFDYMSPEYLDKDAEEEEELLSLMMAEGYALDIQNQQAAAMSSLPRQSDSSGFSARSSGRTWESSMTAATQGTALSTLTESPEMPQYEPPEVPKEAEEGTLPAQDVDVLARKQASPLPPIPAGDTVAAVGLRDRRLSGQSATQLKIETFARRASVSRQDQPLQPALLEIPSAQEKEKHPELTRSGSNTDMSVSTMPITPLASIHSAESTDSHSTPGLTQLLSNSTIDEDGSEPAQSDAQRMLPPVRKIASSSNLGPRNLSLATTDLNDPPATPGSAMFPTHSRQGMISIPVAHNASPNILSNTAVGGMYIFDHIADSSSPTSPRSPGKFLQAEPLPLEPCPESFLLRPFWLMRCLYQTLSHPKGGYITTKLFVPRDIWRVKTVKIKAIEDKMGQCDTLTAALIKLTKVDTLDADAVLEELQSFDLIIDVVRQALTKKLGNDVGLTGSVAAMKNSPAGEDADTVSKTSSSVKSFATSWRKLRSKSSTAALGPPQLARLQNSPNDAMMPSLPMTSNSSVSTSRSYRTQRHPPPTPTGLSYIPPLHANYMSSLARLFDAVQVLDSIARQVEDPGLKATSETQVGLELSIRGAAEFFSFYVIRFAMGDIGMLIDKYLKRSGEWVMT